MYRLQESFEKERKISNFALFGMVCIDVALHGMFSREYGRSWVWFAAIFADWRRDRKWLLQEQAGHHLSEPVTPSRLKMNCFGSNISKH